MLRTKRTIRFFWLREIPHRRPVGGSDSLHVLDVGLSQASDSDIWRYASERQFVLVTKDEDFFYREAQPGAAVQLVWIRLGNCRTAGLLAAIERTWSLVCARLETGERILEIRYSATLSLTRFLFCLPFQDSLDVAFPMQLADNAQHIILNDVIDSDVLKIFHGP